jgi:hypothetical protein
MPVTHSPDASAAPKTTCAARRCARITARRVFVHPVTPRGTIVFGWRHPSPPKMDSYAGWHPVLARTALTEVGGEETTREKEGWSDG